ncbi:FAD dependent oxidoreductase [Paenibacillus sp. OV219]|nr:FAD-dependent oxidoreductase [Paenibacillus sp. OV219]SEO14691.1 FAD dependent oxidoreductase [Paenibacillus sp. OV219]
MTIKHLHEGHLYWPRTMDQPTVYPPLAQNVKADVAIIGGGMSGSICAYILSRSGLKTVLLERGDIEQAARLPIRDCCNIAMIRCYAT